MVSKTLWHGWQAIASLSVYSPLFEELVKRYPGLFADGEDATQRVREMAEALERLKEEKEWDKEDDKGGGEEVLEMRRIR